jgi:hypothetical protein
VSTKQNLASAGLAVFCIITLNTRWSMQRRLVDSARRDDAAISPARRSSMKSIEVLQAFQHDREKRDSTEGTGY